VTSGQGSNDDATDRRLWLLIGLVVVLAAATVTGSIALLGRSTAPLPSAALLIGLVVFIAFASRMLVRIRLQSGTLGSTWGDLAIIIGLVVAPPPWVVLSTVVAITMSKVLTRTTTQRKLFSIAKETLQAAAGGAVFLLSGYQPDTDHPGIHIGVMAAAIAVMWITDELVAVPVLATATHRSMVEMFRTIARLSIVAVVSRFLIAVLIVAILSTSRDIRVLLVIPPVMLSIHFWQAGHERGRQERESWQRLADTTDELNVVELDEVLRSAVMRASQLFAAAEAEIRLPGDGRAVRGSNDTVSYDGLLDADPPAGDNIVTTELSGHDGQNPIGSLRIHFRGTVRLTESETYKLKAFGSALYTAIRNAKAYAELGRIAATNAGR